MADAKELDNIDEKSKLNTESDSAKIKFQPTKNGEASAKIEMPDSGTGGGYQCGLSKEELMKYANDPFWVAMRRILFVLFWLLWIAMLVGAVAIIIITPKCAAPKEPEWYESSPMYELRVDEFADGDGNSKSDLNGIDKKLSHLDEISVSALVLDQLFNPSNQRIILPERGSFDDFTALTAKKKLLLRIPVHEVTLGTQQGKTEFLGALRFWLEKGAAGFVFDGLEKIPKSDLDELLPTWKSTIREFSTEEFPRVSILSAYDKSLPEELYCKHAEIILNYDLTSLPKAFTTEQFLSALKHTAVPRKSGKDENDNSTVPLPPTCRSNIVLSNGDIQPLIDRFDSAERDRLVMFSLLADATPMFYFGEEYAKSDKNLPATLSRDHQSSNPPLPMDWKTVEDLKKSSGANNFYQVFAQAAKLRRDEYAIRMGDTVLKGLPSAPQVVAMSRVKKGNPGFVVVTNFDSSSNTVDLSELGSHIPESGHIDIVSTNSEKKAQKVDLKKFEINGKETIIVQFVPILG